MGALNLLQKIEFIRDHHFHDLNAWEKEFIDDIDENVQGIDPNEIDEYLTRRQKEKIEEIWEDLGL